MGKREYKGTIGLRRSLIPRWTHLDAYIFEEIHFPFAMSMLVFNGVFFIQTFGEVSELAGGKVQLPFDLLALVFLSKVPEMLLLTSSLSFLTSGLIAMGRLSADSEIIAPQAAGVSFFRMNRPILIYAGLLTMLLFFMLNWGAPRVKQILVAKSRAFYDTQAVPNITPGVLTSFGGENLLFVSAMDPENPRLMEDLFMVTRAEGKTELILAEKASLYTNRSLELMGVTNINLSDNTEDLIDLLYIQRWEQPFPISEELTLDSLELKSHELFNTRQLHAVIGAMQNKDPMLSYEMWSRLLTPFICVVLALFVVPLAVRHSRLGKGSGLGASLLIIAVFYIMAKTGKDMVEEGRIPPWAGVAVPLIVYFVVGSLLQIGKNLWWGRFFESRGYKRRWFRYIFSTLLRLVTPKRNRDKSREDGRDGPSPSTFFFPSKLDLYLTKSFFSIYGLVQAAFLMIYMLVDYIQIGEYLRRNQELESGVVVRYFINKIPEIIDTTLFICLLVSVLITLTIMSRSREVTAVRAAGGSLHRFCLPLVAYGLLFSAGTYYVQNTVLPQMVRNSAELKDTIKQRSRTLVRGMTRTPRGDILTWKTADGERNLLIGVNHFSFQEQDGKRVLTVGLGYNLMLQGDRWVVNKPGSSWRFEEKEDGDLQPFPRVHKAGDYIDMDLENDTLNITKQRANEFSIAQLREHIGILKQAGLNAGRYETDLFMKYAQPLSSLIMVLLAIPLGFQFGRRTALQGIGIGLMMGMSYLGLIELFRKLGATAVLNPLTAGWTVIVIFAATALYRFINLE